MGPMGLADFQTVLARLFTDATLRARFLADPTGVGGELGLPPGLLSEKQIQLFAESLVSKRHLEVQKLLPMTNRLYGEEFGGHFVRYAVAPMTDSLQKHRQDALAFAKFLLAQNAPGRTPWAREILRYETASLQFYTSSLPMRAVWFRCPVGWLIAEMAAGRMPSTVPKCPTMGIGIRMGWNGPRSRWLLLSPLRRIRGTSRCTE
jgi:hypothetical protein